MAVVEDRSAEEERDLAQLEMGALMHTASVGVATYDPVAAGWRPCARAGSGRQQTGDERPAGGAGSGLLGIGRELVEPDSLPEYERLQRALRQGERAEVRFAVRHPELGQRWLLTRVEPGALGSDRPTTSVVTLDVTEQEQAQRRNEQLLRELSTILDGSTAGIAYLRGPAAGALQPALRAHAGAGAGRGRGRHASSSLFTGLPQSLPVVQQAAAALADGQPLRAELPAGDSRGEPVWYSLSLRPRRAVARRARGGGGADRHLAPEVAAGRPGAPAARTRADVQPVGRGHRLPARRRIERANQAMATLTGYAAPELTALDGSELHADARDAVSSSRPRWPRRCAAGPLPRRTPAAPPRRQPAVGAGGGAPGRRPTTSTPV
jgi:PAS domain-containing protein